MSDNKNRVWVFLDETQQLQHFLLGINMDENRQFMRGGYIHEILKLNTVNPDRFII